jgi:phosphoglycerol transferase
VKNAVINPERISFGLLPSVGFLAALLRDCIPFKGRRPVLEHISGLTLFGVIFFSVGGLWNTIALETGIHIFRNNSRVAVFLACLGICFLCDLSRRFMQKLSPPTAWAVATALVGFVWWDQAYSPLLLPQLRGYKLQVSEDREFFRLLEAGVPAGTAVYQLPVMPFPEGGRRNGVVSYRQLVPFIFTDSMKWSFGNLATEERASAEAPEAQVRRWLTSHDDRELRSMIAGIRSKGFHGLLINPRYYDWDQQRLISSIEEIVGPRQASGGSQGWAYFSL